MARIQILELPEGDGDDRPPFAVIIDQLPADAYGNAADYSGLAEKLGARAVLAFDDTIDIPANGRLPIPNAEQGIPPGSTYQMTIDGKPLVWEPAQPASQKE